MGYYNSFIIRIWFDDKGEMRGRIEHVLGREKADFVDLSAIGRFIRQHLAPPPMDAHHSIRAWLDEEKKLLWRNMD